MTASSLLLAELAGRVGVAMNYRDQAGVEVQVPDAVVREVLAALDLPASDDIEVQAALTELDRRRWAAVLPPVVVMRTDRVAQCPVHIPHGTSFRSWIELEAHVDSEDEFVVATAAATVATMPIQVEHNVEPRQWADTLIGEALIEIPAGLQLGWHRLVTETATGRHECVLVVTPARTPEPQLRGRGWGFATQLYSVRSAGSWGLGDVADLKSLARWSGGLGADHIIVNPLHAAAPTVPRSASPYLPTSRRFVDPAYLRVEEIPEFVDLSDADQKLISEYLAVARAAAAASELLERDTTWLAKLAALEIVYEHGRSTGGELEFEKYLVAQGQALTSFALWCAIAEECASRKSAWPVDLVDINGQGVPAALERLSSRVNFYSWLQWKVEQQLLDAQAIALAAGQGIGVIHDLAVGVHPVGADVWAMPELFARGVSVGAPPDGYNQNGQDWSQPPWRPDALASAAYAPFRELLRANLAHSGGLRIDHIIGLFRLWWIPAGQPATRGTYVRYDADALLGILALEATRAGAVVVGENLGTVEPHVAEALEGRGLLGTTVLFFERWGVGRINPPENWPADSLAAVTVHDLPPTLGYLRAEHVRIRERLGLLRTDPTVEYALAAAERADWVAFAFEQGALASPDPSDEEVVLALHRILGKSAARLLAISLADAVGEQRAQNQPGTHLEYPNWRIPLGGPNREPVSLEQLVASTRVLDLVHAVSAGFKPQH